MNKNNLVPTWFLSLLLAVFASLALADTEPHAFQTHKAVEWAKPEGIPLTLDIYVPKTGKKSYPVLVIYHGGGWLINDNSPMTAMSEYIASHGEFVVANMNYRLLPDNGNTTTLNQMVEDAFGGLLWVKDNIARYGGDPTRIAITGDSAGGHLTAMILMSGRKLESNGFKGKSLGFKPTYLPKGKTAEKVAKRDGLKVQAAIISYGAFDLYEAVKGGFEKPSNVFWKFAGAEPRGIFGKDINLEDHPEHYKAVSPIYNIPDAKDYQLPPQFIHVAEKDTLTTPAMVGHYVELLKKADQPVTYKIYPGRGHGFMDGGCNKHSGTCFEKDAVPVLDDMLAFLRATLN